MHACTNAQDLLIDFFLSTFSNIVIEPIVKAKELLLKKKQ